MSIVNLDVQLKRRIAATLARPSFAPAINGQQHRAKESHGRGTHLPQSHLRCAACFLLPSAIRLRHAEKATTLSRPMPSDSAHRTTTLHLLLLMHPLHCIYATGTERSPLCPVHTYAMCEDRKSATARPHAKSYTVNAMNQCYPCRTKMAVFACPGLC